MDTSYARWAGITVLAAIIGLVSYGLVRNTGEIGPGRIVMATGSSQYYELAESYRRDLERYGVKYEVQRATEGFATLKALLEAGPGINAGFIKGGLVGSMQGRMATDKAKGRYAEFSKLWSVGRLFYEPIWVFTRGDLPITSLRDLKDKKILLGTKESGTRRIAGQLLKANGVDKSNATLLVGSLPDDAAPLFDGSADAAILIEPADSPQIQTLLRVENIRLMDFSGEAEAYDNRFPAISKVVLRKGAVEFNPLVPSDDITLLATTAALVVRTDMHPALVSLLTHAVIANPKSGFDKAGDPVLFYRAGEFPSASDPEFQVSVESRAIYKSGELPIMLRTLVPVSAYLGLPFSVTAFVSSYAGQMLLVVIPVLALIIPFTRTVPAVYVWMVRRKLFYWYNQLKTLERNLDTRGTKLDAAAEQAELERIDGAVRRIRVPLHFSNELYDLRLHIDLVRQRLSIQPAVSMAAE
ncbi:MAG: ABC transporter substrate-binding protein [Hyphomicrobiaceae bacterium]|nr:ABC transporter substrate-binding protein [Hyphomicrobiaceae bacterium]